MNIFRSAWRGCLDICVSACPFCIRNTGFELHARASEVLITECTFFGPISFKTKNAKLSSMAIIIARLIFRLDIFKGALLCRSADFGDFVMVVFPRHASR